MPESKTTISPDRIDQKLEGLAYTDLELIAHLTKHGLEHSKTCTGCSLESILYYSANRLRELSSNLPKIMKPEDELLREVQVYLFKKHNFGKGERERQRLALLAKLYEKLGEI